MIHSIQFVKVRIFVCQIVTRRSPFFRCVSIHRKSESSFLLLSYYLGIDRIIDSSLSPSFTHGNTQREIQAPKLIQALRIKNELSMMLFSIPFVVFTLLSSQTTRTTTKRNKKPYIKTDHAMLRNHLKDKTNSIVWIDLENVRGKSGFEMSHWELVERTTQWIRFHELEHQVVLVADHGSEAVGYYLPSRCFSILFAGPHEKADDVIAHTIGKMTGTGNSVVVTADGELQSRCRKQHSSSSSSSPSMTSHSLYIMDPIKFLDDLELAAAVATEEEEATTTDVFVSSNDKDDNNSNTAASPKNNKQMERQLEHEIKLRGQLLDLEIQLGRKKKTMTNKRRQKLNTKINLLRQKLALQGPSLLDQITSINNSSGNQSTKTTTIDPEQQELLLNKWRDIRRTGKNRREQTGDRVVYAEQLRRQILKAEEETIVTMADLVEAQIEQDEKQPSPLVPSASVVWHHMMRNGYKNVDDGDSSSSSSSSVPIEYSGMISNVETHQNGIEEEDWKSIHPAKVSTYELLNPPKSSSLPLPSSKLSKSLNKLKVVVVSDTHGFEGQMIDPESMNDILPEGDLLLHLGDFAYEGGGDGNERRYSKHRSLKAFDAWLAKQPHTFKIVVRGNHDPWTCDFPLSGAWYITKPIDAISIGNCDGLNKEFELAVIPYGSPRQLMAASSSKSSSSMISKSCDILATHVPPLLKGRSGLDKTYSGKHVGSAFLTKAVRGMGSNAPRVWFCGHIHEGRGIERNAFGGSTTIINAANANSGRATHLQHGPVVVQLTARAKKGAATFASNKQNHDNGLEILEMEDKTIDNVPSNQEFFQTSSSSSSSSTKGDSTSELLMAIDIGLKSGVALYNRQGALVRYEQFYFERDTLQRDAQELIQEWERDCNEETTFDEIQFKVTHIAMEGADAYMLNAWAEAAPNRSILRVSPEEWRSDLLTAKEKKSGHNAKASSRLIARQIVGDFGMMEQHSGKFKTDVAEAVVMGFYVARKLGWIQREPPVRRYTNGNIVVPRNV